MKCFKRFEAAEGDTPDSLFAPAIPTTASIPAPRYIRRINAREFLIFTDSSCLNSGYDASTGSCAFVFRPETLPSMIPRTTIRSFRPN
jgi:ribonuclease HI